MTGYVRNDTANNIADAKVIQASVLDGEFDAIVAAFDSTSGHTHDGSSAEGAPITVLGPAQEWIASANAFYPKTDDTYDLGTSSFQIKDFYLDGVAYLDEVDIDAGNIDGTVIGGTTPAAITGTTIGGTVITASTNFVGALTGNVTGDLTGNADTSTALATARDITLSGDASGSASFDGTANVTITVAVANDSHSHTLSTVTDAGTIASQDADSVNIDGGAIDGTPVGGSTPSSGAFTTLSASTSLTVNGTAVTNIHDEDDLVSDDASGLATQQSIKAYVDALPVAPAVLLNEQTISGSPTSIDFDSFMDNTTYPGGYLLELSEVQTSTDGRALLLRTSSNSGTSYDEGSSDYAYASGGATGGGNDYTEGNESISAIRLTGTDTLGANATNERGWSGTVRLFRPGLSGFTAITWQGGYWNENNNFRAVVGTGYRLEANTVDGLRLLLNNSATFSGGNIRIWGLK